MTKNENIQKDYISRINRVIDYIENNLDKTHTLDELASIANFSRFYFHRIFRSIVGETLNSFIQRVRIEKAAAKLIADRNKSITEIAIDCGFSSSSVFARSFKDVFKLSASEFRENYDSSYSKNCKEESNNGEQVDNISKTLKISSYYISPETFSQKWRLIMDTKQINIEVKELPELTVAYVRHIGPYKGNEALFKSLFDKIFAWAGPRDLVRFPNTKVLSVYHDSPEITDEDKLRTSICITVPEDTVVDGEVGKMTIPGGKYAVGHFVLDSTEYEEAWNAVMGGWLPQSGYQCADGVCFEDYLNDPKTHPEGKCIVDICVPVKPL